MTPIFRPARLSLRVIVMGLVLSVLVALGGFYADLLYFVSSGLAPARRPPLRSPSSFS